ncbi:hypothetical protein BKA81DRAFT_345177 [Phyllosticta paracitricarpa]
MEQSNSDLDSFPTFNVEGGSKRLALLLRGLEVPVMRLARMAAPGCCAVPPQTARPRKRKRSMEPCNGGGGLPEVSTGRRQSR